MKFLPCECSNALACTQPSIASQVPQLLVDYSTLHLEGLENDSSSLSPSNMQHFEMRPPQCKPLSLQGSSSSYSRRLTVPYQPIWLQEPLLLQHSLSDLSRVGACAPLRPFPSESLVVLLYPRCCWRLFMVLHPTPCL